jgi:integrase
MASKAQQRWPKIKAVLHKNGTRAWQVDARQKGVGERFYYPSKSEAETKADQLRKIRDNQGAAGFALTDAARAEAAECQEKLASVGATLREATAYFLKHAKPENGSRMVKEVVSEFLRLKKSAGLRETYLSVQGYVLGNVFGAEFGERQLHQIGHVEIEDWMGRQTWAPRTRQNYCRDLSNLFGFAQRRGYTAANPVERIELPKVTPKPPGILTVPEAEALLAAAKASGGAMLPAITIGLFCGLRSAEIERLDWRHVCLNLATIEVTAENAKMSERRVVDMPKNLLAWLKPYAKAAGPVAPAKSFDWHLKMLWQAAGMKAWPKNAMRHSFASYHFSQHQNAALTTAQLGHFGSTRTFVSSYRGVVQPSEAAKFWALVPAADEKASQIV